MAVNLSTFTCFYILFILPSALLLVPAVNGRACSYSRCGWVSFPFRTPDQPITCGLPGFDLGCNSSTRRPLISFPSGQSFTVEDISFYSKSISISDPQGCFPKKLLQIPNTSGTPFRFRNFTPFRLYSCSRPQLPNYSPQLPNYSSLSSCSSIDCGGGSTYSVLCVNMNSSLLNDGCEFIGRIMVPGSWFYPYRFTRASYTDLNWDMPAACLRCTGKCYRSSKDISKIKCNVFTPGVIAGVTIATIVTIAVISCIFCKCRKRMRSRTSNRIESSGGTTNTDEPRPNTASSTNRQSNIASGALGRDTLDTYPIIVVGESGRMLSNMEDKTCPICLSDYTTKETLKLLPECLHKFHAECIDEWLCAKPTCPICRTPPPLRS